MRGTFDVSPNADAFGARYSEGHAQVVFTRLVADLETPVSAYLKLTNGARGGHASGGGRMTFLLESVEGGSKRGRYSIIGLSPDVIWRANGARAQINRDPFNQIDKFEDIELETLASLRAFLNDSAIDLPRDLPPMAAGVFGYMGYDTVRLVEHLPNEPCDELGVPDSLLVRPTVMVIFDLVKDEMTIVTPVRYSADVTADKAFEGARERLHGAVRALQAPLDVLPAPSLDVLEAPEPTSNTSQKRYLDMVAKAKDYIVAGDIFQVVLSQRFSAPFGLSSFSLYRSLRRLNPSPFLFHLDFGDFALVGSSPEILVRARDGDVTIRPIAGTRHRGIDEDADKALESELLADPKERSEHLMLLDLGRNDVGRVANVGTIDVTDQFIVERYSHVMHIVSNVTGKLASGCDTIDALMAGFPAGTVSGAPKVRAMEIIDELEVSKRGPYAGCVGYFSADGNMDTCIVLRTGLVKDGMLYVQAGAGIVHDSIPENEQQECVNKAKAIVRAAEEAVRFASDANFDGDDNNGGPFG